MNLCFNGILAQNKYLELGAKVFTKWLISNPWPAVDTWALSALASKTKKHSVCCKLVVTWYADFIQNLQWLYCYFSIHWQCT